MLDRIEAAPMFFAPFVSSTYTVEPQWIDYNGHLNMAFYSVLFDRAVDEAYELIGFGPNYVERHGRSVLSVEVHIRYLRELHVHDRVRATFQLLGFDSKRVHFFQTLCHADEGWVSATSEQMGLHIDAVKRKATGFEGEVLGRLEAMRDAHARLPRPADAGRRIAMPAKVPASTPA